MKDWYGDTNSIFKALGSSHHTEEERQINDYYATDPRAVKMLLDLETFNEDIWEPACGEGHMSKEIEKHGYIVKSSDLINRGFGEVEDFLSIHNKQWNGDIITNPPYSNAKGFIEKALDIIPEGNKIAMFLKITFLEGKDRNQLFTNTPPPYGLCFKLKN